MTLGVAVLAPEEEILIFRTLALWACMMIAGASTAQTNYTVQKGDTIEKIARRVGVSQSAILAANPSVRPERMQIGQKLSIPSANARTSTASSKPVASTGGTHVVRNGESDWTISRKYGISMDQLHRLNPNVDFSPLQIGVKLRVPGGAAPVARTTTVPAAPQAGGTYVVKAGDNDWSLARKFGITMSQLHVMNPGVDFSPLKLGITLRVPGGSSTTPQAQTAAGKITSRNAKVTASAAVVRRSPSTSGARITTVSGGVVAKILDRDGDWYKLRFAGGTEGWVRGDLLAATSASVPVVAASSSRPGAKATAAKRPVASSNVSGELAVLSRAREFMGVRYRYGGTSRSGFDCSGFVQTVFRSQGVRLPRTSAEQSRVGTPVSRSDLQKGDLVFFKTRGSRISHVGIYQGGGRFIHASSGGGKVEVDSLTSGYYDRRYAGARRVIANPKRVASNMPVPREQSQESASSPITVAKRQDPPDRTEVGADEIIP